MLAAGSREPGPAVAKPGQGQAAQEMLAEVYGRFDEGFESPRSAGGKSFAGNAFLNVFLAFLTVF